MKTKLTTTLFLFLLFTQITQAVEDYTVRVIYFQPTDTLDKTSEVLQLMTDTHEFFRLEMIRHGYGDKTFRIETDNNNKIVVHRIQGKHTSQHYYDNDKTHHAISPELPDEFLDHSKYIYIFFIGGLHHVNRTILGMGVTFFGIGVNGGYALIPFESNRFDIIVHELGHTFGLRHNKHRTTPDYVMGRNGGIEGLEKYECRWLSKSYYFNDNNPRITSAPKVTHVYNATRIEDDISLKIDVVSQNGIFQSSVSLRSDSSTIATSYSQTSPITFHFKSQDIRTERQVFFNLLDNTGIHSIVIRNIVIPSKPITKNPILPEEPTHTHEPEIPHLVPTKHQFTTSWGALKRKY